MTDDEIVLRSSGVSYWVIGITLVEMPTWVPIVLWLVFILLIPLSALAYEEFHGKVGVGDDKRPSS